MSTKTRLTYDDYALIPDDGQCHEIIDGEHFVNPAPGTYHQDVSRHVQFQLYSKIELTGLGRVYNAPVDVQLTQSDIVQPDLVVILQEKYHGITPAKIQCVPDLIVEVLSPSTGKYDRIDKKRLYERENVPEYWIVDPWEQNVAQWLLNESGHYADASVFTSAVSFQGLPEPVTVDLTKVW